MQKADRVSDPGWIVAAIELELKFEATRPPLERNYQSWGQSKIISGTRVTRKANAHWAPAQRN
jgi:hypothetical protein